MGVQNNITSEVLPLRGQIFIGGGGGGGIVKHINFLEYILVMNCPKHLN